MIEKPRVSVVTPSYNMARYLQQTIESVFSQDYSDIEYIVMDGGSQDGTTELLERYGDRLHYVSRPDGGAAEAINRGFEMSSGSILAWLNADDVYLPGAVGKAVQHLLANPDLGAVHGEANWVDEQGQVIAPYPTRPCDASELSQYCCVCQPACFFRRDAFERAGRLDATLQSAFDYDLWVRMAAQTRFGFLPSQLANSRMHRANKTLSGRDQVFEESFRVLKHHYGYIPFAWIHSRVSYYADGRDLFFKPLQPTFSKYLVSLPVGCWHNRDHLLRYCRDWTAQMSTAGMLRRLTGRGSERS